LRMPCPSPSFRSLSKTKTTGRHGMSPQAARSDTHNNVTSASVLPDTAAPPGQFPAYLHFLQTPSPPTLLDSHYGSEGWGFESLQAHFQQASDQR